MRGGRGGRVLSVAQNLAYHGALHGIGGRETRERGAVQLARVGLADRAGDKVRFLGFVEDFMTLLAIADIQVHPSDNEGVPLSVLAGMAAAKPLVATSVGGLNEILRNGSSAMLVPPGDPSALAAAIANAAANRPRLKRLIAHARAGPSFRLAAGSRRASAVR